MNYKQLTTILILFLIPIVSADRVGVIVDFPDGSNHIECLSSPTNTNGFDLLNKLSLPTLWGGPGSFGHQLCKVNNIGDSISGTGCSFSGKYWRFLNNVNNNWEYMPVGFDAGNECWNNDFNSFNGHYCVNDENVIGISYGEFADSFPSTQTFEDICNPLTLTDVKVYVDGKKESDADEDGGNIEADPGSELEFRIELENTFNFDDNLVIEDIEAKITIEDIDDGRNLDKKVKFKDLEVDEEDDEKISIKLPLTLEDDDYDIILKIKGKTSTGIKQEITVNYDLEIDKEKHNLIFSKLNLESQESCPETSNSLLIEIKNIGENNEYDTLLTIKNDNLNLNFKDRFDIDEGEDDSTYRKEIPFNIPNIAPRDYEINITLDYSELTRESVTLTIIECNPVPITGNLINQQQLNNQITQATPKLQTFETQTFFQNYAIPILLAIFLIFLIVAIIYIISIL